MRAACETQVLVSTPYGRFPVYVYDVACSGIRLVALVKGELSGSRPVSVRVYMEAGPQAINLQRPAPALARHQRRVAGARNAVLVCAQVTQTDQGTVTRCYSAIARLLAGLGVRQVLWMASPAAVPALQSLGVRVLPNTAPPRPIWAAQSSRRRLRWDGDRRSS